jgi:uncharacterized protein (TIGR00369 family)
VSSTSVDDEPAGLQALRARFQDGTPIGVADLLAFECDASPRFANPMGGVHGGIIATLLDSALGCAVQTVLPDQTGYTTLSLEVKYLRPVAVDAGPLTATGTVVHAGRRQATAEGTLIDDAGRLLASATCTCLVMGPPPT